MTRKRVNDLLQHFARQEASFLGGEFLAPAVRGGTIRVRIAGSVCQLRFEPTDFEGWGVFQPLSFTDAILVRESSLAERRRYLDLFPRVRLIVCLRRREQWMCATSSRGDLRLRVQGLVSVAFIEEVQQFDILLARYDGSRFSFDELDRRRDPGSAAYLRSQLGRGVVASDLQRAGLTPEERAAYELNQWQAIRRQERAERRLPERRRRSAHHVQTRAFELSRWESGDSDAVRARLRDNLSHAGAELIDYLERSDSFRVSYLVDGEQFTSSVDKHDLTVQSAGICLEGTDRNFDLASLVGVLREGRRGGARSPDGLSEFVEKIRRTGA